MCAAFRRAVVDSWASRGVLTLLLRPVAGIYGLLARLQRQLYSAGLFKVERVALPVIVVGNVVAGGSGKTPLVILLVQYLKSRGIKAGVLSRGYGRRGNDCRSVRDDSEADEVGDEPILIHRATGRPVFVARARIEAARALMARHPDVEVLVCDDGLQHHGLHRDIEICVFDQRGLGNGLLLPAGPLRERWPRPADLVVYAGRRPFDSGFAIQRSLATDARRSDGTHVALEALRHSGVNAGPQLWAVAGIAQPEAFFSMLRARGLALHHTVALGDHATFEARRWSRVGNEILLCTEKDAVKLWRVRPDALAVPLLVEIDPAFWTAFDKLLAARTGAKLSFMNGHTTS